MQLYKVYLTVSYTEDFLIS